MDLVSKSVSQAVRRSTISFSQKQLIGVLSNFAWRKFWGKKTKTFFKIELFGNLQKFNLLTCLFVPPKWRIMMFFIILRAGCSQFCLPFNQIVWFFDHQYLRKKSIWKFFYVLVFILEFSQHSQKSKSLYVFNSLLYMKIRVHRLGIFVFVWLLSFYLFKIIFCIFYWT